MADTKAPEFLAKITMKALGNPKVAAGFTAGDGQRHFLGRVEGLASGKVQKLDDQGEILTGLKGVFRATKADGTQVNSGVLYLPGGIQEAIEEAQPDDQGRVIFAFDLYTEAATNKAGYSYVAQSLYAPTQEADPFSVLGALPEMPKIAALAKK